MSDELILYDLPAKDGKAWSWNPWKTRLLLNYKGIPYKTEWIEYPDLKPTFQKLGIPPNEGVTKYSSPTIRLPNGGEYIADSRVIALALEPLYPTPSLHLDSPVLPRVDKILGDIITSLRPVFMPLVPKLLLNPPSEKYFIETREKTLGKSLDEYATGFDKAFEDVQPHVKSLVAVLNETPDGPFFLGKEVSFADFPVVATLQMFARLGLADKIWALDGGAELKTLYEAAGKWLERESY